MGKKKKHREYTTLIDALRRENMALRQQLEVLTAHKPDLPMRVGGIPVTVDPNIPERDGMWLINITQWKCNGEWQWNT